MVRKAGACFDSQFRLRSYTLETVLDEYRRLGKEVKRLQAELVDELYTAVPRAKDRSERWLLLGIKREVFNGQPAEKSNGAALPQSISERVFTYNSILKTRQGLLDSNRDVIFNELRSQIEQLLEDEQFCCLLDYSCPWLRGVHRRDGPGDYGSFSDGERGIYAFATKLFSKANPFYTFASVAFPSESRKSADCSCEIIIDLSVILRLERILLSVAAEPHRRSLYIHSFLPMGNSFGFLTIKDDQLRLVSIKDTAMLRCILGYFDRPDRHQTFEDCVDYICESSPSIEKADVEKTISALIQLGILKDYLVRDFDRFDLYLSDLSSEHEQIVTQIKRFHLACVSKEDLPAIHRQLTGGSLAEKLGPEPLPENIYYVNVYEHNSASLNEHLAERVYDDLRAIKPFFRVSNFSDRSYLFRAFLLDKVARHSRGRVPYLEALCEFLRDINANIKQYHPSSHSSEAERRASLAWLRRLTRCGGHLTSDELETLLPDKPGPEPPASTLCFNGTFDYREGYYYLSNILAGDGRFASRYLLHQGTRRYGATEQDEEWLDVQLMPLLSRNRNYISTVFKNGCGFDARFRHLFERWIDPSLILVEAHDGRIVYRDGVTKKPIRFHFFGFLLGQFLTPEYQLLLIGHGDYYLNPFDQYAVEREAPEGDEVNHLPPLYYGPVCLRREQWAMRRHAFEKICREDDILASTAHLREIIHKASGTETDDWYYREMKVARGGAKPRYLDLCNPLSVNMFRRAIAGWSDDGVVSFARMEPTPDRLYTEEQGRFVTEVMIEV